MDKQEANSLKQELQHFTGSESFHKNPLFPRYVYTEGVKFLAEKAGAYWLLDYIFANQMLDILKTQPFQTWKITVLETEAAFIEVGDGDENKLISFILTYTDFPLQELTLWLVDNTLMLTSEY